MTYGDAYRAAEGAQQVNSRGYSEGGVISARHARDVRLRELWESGRTGADIGDELGMDEHAIWYAVKRLKLRRRRGAGHYGTPAKRSRPNRNISRIDSAVRAYHLPVTVDEGADGGLICYIGDVPGEERGTLEAAIHSAVAAQG